MFFVFTLIHGPFRFKEIGGLPNGRRSRAPTSGRPGPARHSRRRITKTQQRQGCTVAAAVALGAPPPCSNTGFHPPGLIHPAYWPVLGSQSLLNPRDHPRYLPPCPIDRTRPGPGGYRCVSRERGLVLLGSQSLLNPWDHPRYLPPYPIDRTRLGLGGYQRVSRERARLPRPPLHFPLESVYLWWQIGQGRAGQPRQFEKENRNKINKKVKSF
jgi:hypothetical protein